MAPRPHHFHRVRSWTLAAFGMVAMVSFGVSCKGGTLRSPTTLPGTPQGAPATSPSPSPAAAQPKLESELTGVSIVQTGYLYSIANPKVPTEKCWYLAEQWGQNFGGATKAQNLDKLRPLTVKSMSTEAVKRALSENTAKEKSWQEATRFVLAGCGLAMPFAKTLPGAVAVAICGAGGSLAEKAVGDKVSSAGRAGEIAAGQTPTGNVSEKQIIEVFEASLRGRTGDGSLNCSQALAAARPKSSPRP